jgi:hypothetical protein
MVRLPGVAIPAFTGPPCIENSHSAVLTSERGVQICEVHEDLFNNTYEKEDRFIPE